MTDFNNLPVLISLAEVRKILNLYDINGAVARSVILKATRVHFDIYCTGALRALVNSGAFNYEGTRTNDDFEAMQAAVKGIED